jgi:pilus assembly protein Flp/PilA
MRNLLKKFLSAESGASAAEYALLVALIGGGIAIAAGGLGTAISTALTSASTSM